MMLEIAEGFAPEELDELEMLGFKAPEAIPLVTELAVTALPLLTAVACCAAVVTFVVNFPAPPPESPAGGADEIVVVRPPDVPPLPYELDWLERPMVAGVELA